MEPFQDTSHPESTHDPADMSHLDTHTPTPRSRGVRVTRFADQLCRFRLPISSRGITEGDNRVERHCGQEID